MGQLKITMPDDLRAKLDQASADSSLSVAEEIRSRVERTFQEDSADPPTRELMDSVQELAELVKLQTGRSWHEDVRAANILFEAIVHRFVRLYPRIRNADREPFWPLNTAVEPLEKFLDDELPPERPVDSDNQLAWSVHLESIDFHVRWAASPQAGSRQRKEASEFSARWGAAARQRRK
jgi:hypothetical protein